MKFFRQAIPFIFLIVSALLLAGCGSSSEDHNPQAATPVALEASSSEFPNAGLLVSADSVQANISAGQVATTAAAAVADRLVIIDARSASDYAQAHIAGAINLQPNTFWTKGVGLNALDEIAEQLGAAGIATDTTVVIYDNTSASWGAAGRLFWMLEYLGCTAVHILDGGWDKWVTDQRPTDNTAVTLTETTFIPMISPEVKSDAASIIDRLYDRDFAIIDARTDEEFMGWQLYGETRGGHLPRAVHIPYAWFFNSDKTTLGYAELKTLLESRGITLDKEVTSYCTAGIRSGYVYFLLRLMGYQRASNYDASLWDWADNTDYPMEKAPNYSTAVYPAWVKALIDYHAPGSTSAAPPEYPYARDHKYVIFETQWGSFEDMEQGWADNSYLLGHIPGAIHSNSDTYENGFPRWFLLPDEDLKAAVGNMGITADTTVVVYSNSPIFAARLWWVLHYAGVTDVRLLNGGFAAWQKEGLPVESTINNPVATTYDGTVLEESRATTEHVEVYYDNGETQLVDVRASSEYAGLISGYGYLVNKGRIPGAIWAYDADDAGREYGDSDGTLRSYTEVRNLWAELGIQSDQEMIFYCGGGYRSALTYFHAYLMGYANIRNYSDGWAGWSTTYVEDPSYTKDPDIPGSTDGWRQELSGRPFETGWDGL